jgi:CO/xanthine dehydrogenase FAD-binding subunit
MTVFVPTSLTEALHALRERPDALVLAGGTDAMVEINSGHRRPIDVVSVTRVPELTSWRHDPSLGTVRIGAGITYADVLTSPLSTLLPALAQAARTVGSPQIRQAATIGGNLATASPAGDGLPVFAALDATVHLASVDSVREVPIAEFFTGPKRTVRRPDELLTAVTVGLLDGWQGYAKIGVRNAMVISAAGACLATDHTTRSVRIALGAVGPTILRCPDAEAYASEHVDWDVSGVDGAVVAEFARRVAATSRPIDDHRSSAEYRRHAIGVLAGRLLRRAFPNG